MVAYLVSIPRATPINPSVATYYRLKPLLAKRNSIFPGYVTWLVLCKAL